MSKNNKTKDAVNDTPSMLIVDNSTTTAKNCAKKIGAVLKNKNLGFEESKLSNGKRLFLLRAPSGCVAYDKRKNRSYQVIPLGFFNKDSNPYWLAVSLVFASIVVRDKYKNKLEEVNLFVFKGTMSDPEKEAFFRAEWYIPMDDNKRDAQPHWHVYRTLQDNKTVLEDLTGFQSLAIEDAKDFSEEVTSPMHRTELQEEKETPFEKFHFAMSSSWHLKEEHQIYFTTEQSLYDWISRCISYIKAQLEHVSKKGGTGY